MTPGLISIIIVNYNGAKFLSGLLRSLADQDGVHPEVLIVDNGSQDNSKSLVELHYPTAHWIEIGYNSGFSHANNVGIQQATGEFIMLLNNDTELAAHCLSAFLLSIKDDGAKVGMWNGKVLFFHQRDTIDNTGHLIYPDGLNRGRGRLQQDYGQFDHNLDIAFPSGCAGLYRRKVFDQIGMLDERFFMYGEDADLGLRARLSGWECRYVPQAVILHHSSATSGQYSAMKAFFVERNRIWVMWKNYPGLMIVLSPWYTVKRLFLNVFGLIVHRGAASQFSDGRAWWQLPMILMKSWCMALTGLGSIVQQRRDIQKQQKVSSREIWSWFSKYRITARELTLTK